MSWPPTHPSRGRTSVLLTSLLWSASLFAPAFSSPTDPISGQHLLGSSFGIPGLNASFDYVIVGGGTAGLAVANRLSASGEHSVAVIEAGGFYELENGNNSQIPRYVWAGAGLGFEDVNPLVDWEFETEPEEGIGGKKIHYTRGRTLGGSSARNHMIYHRATKGSYKLWAENVGDASFEWENFSKYYDRSTTFHSADASKRWANSTPPHDPAGERAKSGPVQISYANYVLPFTSWALKAAKAVGMKPLPGYLDGDLIGSGWSLRTTDPKTMVRDSSETAYLRPALKRPNLIIYKSTTALNIVFNGTEATGVSCSTLGKKFGLTARKEVIVSAGAVQSPQLLMVSGIGPRQTLEKFSIPVLVDAPGVGLGLEDHPSMGVTYKVRVTSSTVLNTPAKNQAATEEFIRNGAGPLASTGGDVLGWEKVPRRLVSNSTAAALNKAPSDWPDLEYLTQSSYPGIPPDQDDYAGITAVLVNTFSRGTISISSASMLDPPVLHIAFLTDPRDQEVAVAAIKRAREIFADPSLAPVVVGAEVVPGNGTVTDAQILAYIQKNSRTISHVSCTCKMGKREDKLAVVDSEGKVFGVKKLRVVDLSAVPFLPPGHPVATVYALAEKAAEKILQGK
ncbi:GMC oxidoreductase [Cucurbitaria berberidis CBS 394.84]|uniref:GMC oxidoreductase n=1 Tax=Cucurbitaria berberidis CBS 394.84 TaxID=1168544 RepID=A0A9P4GU69_9PLEO|nr:GMC oxidoreductase [Cucurbitaria berberidis CBS 394.84]KAF1851835.1 GMC oxidoreductase [Cucurbitaria berberidis CBS 394.84]